MWDFCVLVWGVPIAYIDGGDGGAMLGMSFVMSMCGVI